MLAPTLGVVIPATRLDSYLYEAVESVLAQSLLPTRVVVVLSGQKAVAPLRWAEGSIDFVSVERQLGVAEARNKGLTRVADMDFIGVLDADDRALPDRFERQILHLVHNPDIDALGGSTQLIGPKGEHLGSRPGPFLGPERIKRQLVFGNPLVHSTMMIRTRALLSVGGYAPECRKSVDYDLWLRMVIGGHVLARLAVPLAEYRVHSAQISRTRNASRTHVYRIARMRMKLAKQVDISSPSAATSVAAWSVRRILIDNGIVQPRLLRHAQLP